MKTTKLKKIEACSDAREWVATQKNYKEAWQNCERGDWMLWLAQRLKVDDRKLTLAKFKCANQVRHLMKDQRSLDALDAAEKYGNGEISSDELNAASDAAYAAYAAASDAASAAYAAAYAAAADAAYAAYAASYAAAYAASAASAAAAAAAYAASYTAARKESLKRSANFCREILTEEVLTAYAKIR
jgi:hypothetical protein